MKRLNGNGMSDRESDNRISREAKSDRPRVSVVIPVFNRLQFLGAAIESVLRQSYPNIEVIVVDDGSPLDPGPVVAQYGSRLRLIRKANGGLASARNYGVAHAAGDYLLFLDDDDFLEPRAIDLLVAALQANPASAWAAGKFAYVGERGERLSRTHQCQYASGDVYERMIFNNLMGAPSVVLIRTDAIKELGLFDESLLLSEDWDLWLSAAKRFPLVVISDIVTNYRIHGQQISKQWNRHLDYHFRVLRKHKAMARPGTEPLFERGIGKLHRRYGDEAYWRGDDYCAARSHWRAATDLGAMNLMELNWRLGKSYVPRAFRAAFRAGRSSFRGLAFPR